MDATNPTPLMTVPEAAARLRVSRATAYRLISRGELPALRLGNGSGPIRVPQSELEAWLDSVQISPARTLLLPSRGRAPERSDPHGAVDSPSRRGGSDD
jgi:excisionase family DNA binding protein